MKTVWFMSLWHDGTVSGHVSPLGSPAMVALGVREPVSDVTKRFFRLGVFVFAETEQDAIEAARAGFTAYDERNTHATPA